MRKNFIGIYARYLQQYIDYKRQLGFKQETEEAILAVLTVLPSSVAKPG